MQVLPGDESGGHRHALARVHGRSRRTGVAGVSADRLPSYLTDWPGKSALVEGGPEHPAACHMLDVGAVAEVLLAADPALPPGRRDCSAFSSRSTTSARSVWSSGRCFAIVSASGTAIGK